MASSLRCLRFKLLAIRVRVLRWECAAISAAEILPSFERCTLTRFAGEVIKEARIDWNESKNFESFSRGRMAGAAARCAADRTVGMLDVYVELVMAALAFPRPRTRYNLRLWARRFERDYLAQVPFLRRRG